MLKYCFSLCFLVWLTSCGTDHQQKVKQVFRYNEHGNVNTLDPVFARNQRTIWPVHQIFSGLVQTDSLLQIKPDIAKSWTVSKNGLQIDFNLRKDVYFHPSPFFGADSTRTVVAQDFVYSFDRLSDPQTASPGAWVLHQVDRYSALNDSVFRIQLKQAFPAFLGVLSMQYCSVVPKEVVQGLGNRFSKKPIGTGPFLFKRWEENIKLVLRKNKRYYERDEAGIALPYLEAVSITFLPSKQSEFMEFMQGKLDFINALDNSYKDELLTPEGLLNEKYSGKIHFRSSPYLNTEYIGIFLDNPAPEIQSLKLRRALNYGFDRKKMVRYLRNNMGTPANQGFVPTGLQTEKGITGFDFDPHKAQKLVNEYKTETGDMKPQLVLSTDANYIDVCEYLQRSLQQIGIDIKIEVLPASALRQAKSSGKLQLFRASWIADYPDPENYFLPFYSENFTPLGPNYTHFKNPLFDQYFEESYHEVDPEKRAELYAKMDQLVIDHAAIIPLFYDKAARFTQPNVKGLVSNPVNLLTLKTVYKE